MDDYIGDAWWNNIRQWLVEADTEFQELYHRTGIDDDNTMIDVPPFDDDDNNQLQVSSYVPALTISEFVREHHLVPIDYDDDNLQ